MCEIYVGCVMHGLTTSYYLITDGVLAKKLCY
jgi:hypothetical protein